MMLAPVIAGGANSTLGGSGGTTFTQSIAGSLTAEGRVLKKGFVPISGTTTASGSLDTLSVIKQTLSGMSTASGTLTKTTKKALTGSVTAVGTFAKVVRKVLTGSITVTGALVRKISRLLTASVSPTGALIAGFRFTKALLGSITASGDASGSLIQGGAGESGLSTPLLRTKNLDGTMKSVEGTRTDLLNVISTTPRGENINDLWHTFFDEKNIPDGDLNWRMVRWLKTKKGLSGRHINDLMNKWKGQL